MLTKLNKLWRDQRGANAVEYIIIVALVAICALGAYKEFGGSVKAAITSANNEVKTLE